MRYLLSALIVLALCVQVYPQSAKALNGKKPFRESEKIDTDLLQALVNQKLGEILRQAGSKAPLDERVIKAANTKMRNPDIKDETDENGFFVPAVKIILNKDGYDCAYASDLFVEAKTTCPTIRNFDASDTYENVASRFVDRMFEGNRELVTSPHVKAWGAGAYAYEDWERTESGPILNEPKCTRVMVLFVFVQ